MVTGVKKLGGTLGSVAAGGVKVFTAGVAAASAGVTVLGKKAVESFADYEQLVGGIETLFGAGGITKVQDYAKSVGKSVSEVKSEFNMLMEAQTLALDNANKAYATAGLSANDYMETVTSFAASLKQSCKDELEAAEAANQAVIDMSDNANKMGTDMTMIQNAYQGFAKQNYTMLDNLKLGYGGTKEEMQRLLEDAEKLSGIKYDISNLNDVFSAIHVIQEELGITGTTAKEASTTIAGSLNMTKAAWSNMLVAMTTDSMDFDTAVNNLVESAAVAAENLLPRIEATLNGMGELIEALLPVIMDRVPAIINDVLPSLIQSGIGMITALVEGIHQNLPQILSSAREIVNSILTGIGEIVPLLFEIGFSILLSIAQGITEEMPTIVQAIVEIIPYISDAFNENAPILLQAALDLFMAIVDAIPLIIQGVVENLPQIITAFIDGLIGAVPQLLEASIILLMAL
ncbi:MAG: phage tail protein, partial [Lachnospiraceae bacterium]